MAAPAAGSGDDLSLPIDVDLIKVLASDTRRDILRHLGERRRTLTELAEILGLKKATVLEHLQKLVAAGLILRMDDGERLWVYYELSPRGKRIVRPERTRFYLMLAGSGVALLVIGALVAAAMLANVGPVGQDATSDSGAPSLADDVVARTPVVLWRGLDEGVAIPIEGPAPEGAQIVALHGVSPVLLAPVTNGKAILSAEQIDAIPSGRYPLTLRAPEGDLALHASIDVRDPPMALAPLAIRAGDTTRLVLSLGEPGLAIPANVTVLVDGAPIALGESGRDRTLDLAPAEGGMLDLRVGRLQSFRVLALDDLRASVGADNDTLHIRVRDATESVAVHLDNTPLGTTNATGALDAPLPTNGEHRVRLASPDGRRAEFPLRVQDGSVGIAATRVRLDAFSSGQDGRFAAAVDVLNSGVANETLTLIASIDGARIASALVEVPANGRAQATLAADTSFDRNVKIEAFSTRASTVLAPRVGQNFTGTTSGAGEPSRAPPLAPAAGAHDQTTSWDVDALGAPDASTTLAPRNAPTSAPVSDQRAEPAVPGPGLGILLVALALLALALRKKKA